MSQPIIFPLHGPSLSGGPSCLGIPAFLYGRLPLPPTKYLYSGVTYDNVGAVLGSCVVSLYRTVDDLFMERVTSDPITGAYQFSAVAIGQAYYARAVDATGAFVGTTLNTTVAD